MHAVVTGGVGFIGSHIARELGKKSHQVTIIDDFSCGTYKNILDININLIADDLTKKRTLEKLVKPNVIFHQASISDTRELDESKVINANLEMFRNVLTYARDMRIPVIYASSAAVYGNGQSPMREDQSLKPLNPYGYSKLAMEQLAQQFSQDYSFMQVVGLRYFNVYGPNESHKKGFCSMITQLAEQIKNGERPKIFKDGEQKRDQIYVKDVVKANLLALESGKSGIYNVGTGNAVTFNRIIEELYKVFGGKKKLIGTKYIFCHYEFFQAYTCADISKIQEELGHQPEYDLSRGIRDYFAK